MIADDALARALGEAKALEQQFRGALDQTPDVADHDQVLIAGRQATALRKSLETWIGLRAVRAAVPART